VDERSLGTQAILWLITRAVELDLPHVYLGYWVEESRKMAYKAKFRPSEVLRGGQWTVFGEKSSVVSGRFSGSAPTPALLTTDN
jgi:arginine-tRNA-protein transferase